ncbi:hypothetical protein, partial [Rhizobium rhizogenes]|uniref:hypothetical protein n=1 Tax=Rhizobium rhizogenes TaxID=359 RepID=UPI0024BE597C
YITLTAICAQKVEASPETGHYAVSSPTHKSKMPVNVRLTIFATSVKGRGIALYPPFASYL